MQCHWFDPDDILYRRLEMLASELWRNVKVLEKMKIRERRREREEKGELQYELMQSEYTSIEK